MVIESTRVFWITLKHHVIAQFRGELDNRASCGECAQSERLMLPIADRGPELGQIEDLIGRPVARRAAAHVFAPQMQQINIDMEASKGRSLTKPLPQATFLKPLTSDHQSFERIGSEMSNSV